MPITLTPEEQRLLVGKSSKGMYFELDRCVHCGQGLYPHGAQFVFCSKDCERDAYRPYIPEWMDEDVKSCTTYRELELDIRAARAASDEYIQKECDTFPPITKEILLSRLTAKQKRLVDEREELVRKTYSQARDQYQNKWWDQRDYVLRIEKQKLAERQQVVDKKRAEEEEKCRIEDEKWRPRPFKL